MPDVSRPVVAYVAVTQAEFERIFDTWNASHRCSQMAQIVGCCHECENWYDEYTAITDVEEAARTYDWIHGKALAEHLRRDAAEQERAALAEGRAQKLPYDYPPF